MEIMEYRGFIGSAEASVVDRCLHGKVLNCEHLVSYEGNTFDELEKEFHEMVDYYIESRPEFEEKCRKHKETKEKKE